MPNERASNGQQRGYFSKSELDGTHDQPDRRISKQSSKGTSCLDRAPEPKKQSCALARRSAAGSSGPTSPRATGAGSYDSTSKGNQANVPLFQPSRKVVLFVRGE
jgi:hypothetical protein